MATILVASADGLRSVDGPAAEPEFPGRSVTAVVRDGPQLWAIVDGSELWYAPEGTWRLVATLEEHRATCLAMTDAIHVGTSEARLHRLEGDTLARVTSFDDVEGRDAWYTPWGGPPDTRSFSEWGEDVYVNVHVGGIVHTNDGGATWSPTIDVDADVHQVATAEGLVFAACAGGLATSTDAGASWSMRSEGLEAPYSRAVVVCGDHLLVSASNGPRGGRAGVYRTGLDGGTFQRCVDGLPGWFDDNIDTSCLDALNDGSFAAFGTSDGQVFGSTDGGRSWQQLAEGLPPVQGLLVVPD